LEFGWIREGVRVERIGFGGRGRENTWTRKVQAVIDAVVKKPCTPNSNELIVEREKGD